MFRDLHAAVFAAYVGIWCVSSGVCPQRIVCVVVGGYSDSCRGGPGGLTACRLITGGGGGGGGVRIRDTRRRLIIL